MKRVLGFWKRGGAQRASKEAARRRDKARAELRILHGQYIQKGGARFWFRPFVSLYVPGWLYLPVEDNVILQESFDMIRGLKAPPETDVIDGLD